MVWPTPTRPPARTRTRTPLLTVNLRSVFKFNYPSAGSGSGAPAAVSTEITHGDAAAATAGSAAFSVPAVRDGAITQVRATCPRANACAAAR